MVYQFELLGPKKSQQNTTTMQSEIWIHLLKQKKEHISVHFVNLREQWNNKDD